VIGVRFPAWKAIFLFAASSRQALGLTQLLSSAVRRPFIVDDQELFVCGLFNDAQAI
jgi:hypothetical protein